MQSGQRVPLRVLPLSEYIRGLTAPGAAGSRGFSADRGDVPVPGLCQRRPRDLYTADSHGTSRGDKYQEDPAADEKIWAEMSRSQSESMPPYGEGPQNVPCSAQPAEPGFETHGPRAVLLTDITYISNGKAPAAICPPSSTPARKSCWPGR